MPLPARGAVAASRGMLPSIMMASIGLRPGVSRAQALYENLREEVVPGRLAPGDRLTEQAVARAATISRTPVREALQRLQSDGLVSDSSGRGLEVRGVSQED